MSEETEKQNQLWHLTMPIRWGDMDALGHVNNTLYFRYFEIARMQWVSDVMRRNTDLSNTGTVIVDAHCEFLQPLVYPAEITITLSGGKPGRSSFNSYYTIETPEQGLTTRGCSRIVWYNNVTQKSMPLPDYVLAVLPEV